ncbi:hypothetical protein [Lentzea sp. NPDC092896]|uniref:hypothetical protein n=1 Tax=Lentzea sp. NPDC092896 TaxID=3364127 RepID=UPI0038063777
MIAKFNTTRDAEYAEGLERLPALRDELAAERGQGRLTDAEFSAFEDTATRAEASESPATKGAGRQRKLES